MKDKKYILWLDDDTVYRRPERMCPDFSGRTWRQKCFREDTFDLPLIWVHTYQEFVETIIDKGIPTAISFDNDLGQEDMEGKHCAKWLLNHCINNNIQIPAFHVHSANNIAAVEIVKILRDDYAKYLELQK